MSERSLTNSSVAARNRTSATEDDPLARYPGQTGDEDERGGDTDG